MLLYIDVSSGASVAKGVSIRFMPPSRRWLIESPPIILVGDLRREDLIIEHTRRHVRIFYRIVLTNPPTRADFTSDTAQGRPPRSQDQEAVRLASGLSVFATLAQAQSKARAFPWLGQYVAMIEIEIGGSIHFERTLLGSRGHHTVWGDPAALLARVESVVPCDAPG